MIRAPAALIVAALAFPSTVSQSALVEAQQVPELAQPPHRHLLLPQCAATQPLLTIASAPAPLVGAQRIV